MTIRSGAMSERTTFWVSVLIHVLILAIYLLMLWHPRQHPVEEKSPALFVPSYAYQSPAPPSPQMTQARPLQQQAELQKPVQAKPLKQSMESQKSGQLQAEVTTDEKDVDFNLGAYHAKQVQMAKTSDPSDTNLAHFKPHTAASQPTDPVHMIGEKLNDDPLKKLLGIAITRHLYYPQAAQELFMRGVVAVGFTLFPDGTATGVRVMDTSKHNVLDAAAVAAVKDMGPVANVDIYVKKPRFLVVNVIFR